MAGSTDINKASVEELERASQVNRQRAQKIIEERDKSGGFKSWDEVKRVPGISEKMIQNLQEAGFTVGGQGRKEASGENAGGGQKGSKGARSNSGGSDRESEEEAEGAESGEEEEGEAGEVEIEDEGEEEEEDEDTSGS